jgi:hypothetical protein
MRDVPRSSLALLRGGLLSRSHAAADQYGFCALQTLRKGLQARQRYIEKGLLHACDVLLVETTDCCQLSLREAQAFATGANLNRQASAYLQAGFATYFGCMLASGTRGQRRHGRILRQI